VSGADVRRGDAEHVHMAHEWQHCHAAHPRAAVHAEWKAHVVRMVVQHHDLDGLIRLQALDQRPAQVMKIATAHEHRAVLLRQQLVEHGTKALHSRKRATEADRLLPVFQRQHQPLR
jgi:hypothetical protein